MKNGFYHNGTVFINVRSGDPKVQIFSHELTHSTETADCYGQLRDLVLERIRQRGADLDRLREDKIALYERNGVSLDADGAEKEFVAQYVADHLLTDEESIRSLVQENRGLGERIRSWLDGILAKLGNTNAQERVFIRRARDLYARALNQTRQKSSQAGSTEVSQEESAEKVSDWESFREEADRKLEAGEITEEEYEQWMDYADAMEASDGMQTDGAQYSFAGVNARNADMEKLEQAKALEDQEVAMETIRQQTGWFRGRDGKWRFEIDDSGMSYQRRGDLGFRSRITEYDRYRNLIEKAEAFMLGNGSEWLTDEEQAELTELQKTWSTTFREDGRVSPSALPQNKLTDYVRHDALFDAYPQLKDARLVFEKLPKGVRGSYNPGSNTVTVSDELRHGPEAELVHEIQHAIQEIEGFSGGSSVQSWEKRLEEGFDSRRASELRKAMEAQQELDRIRDKEPEFYQDMMELDAMAPAGNRDEEHAGEWSAYDIRYEELAEKWDETKIWDFVDLLYEQEKGSRLSGRSAQELYLDTAGEIEARNASGRRNLTAQERKKTPPNLGGEDTVFADRTDVSAEYVGKTESGIEIYETSESVKRLPWKERKKRFLKIMQNQYRGRTAKFIRNGHACYAQFDVEDITKNIYGDNKSDQKGRDAKINVGADGRIFELVEHSAYAKTDLEEGKSGKVHKGVLRWDYFVKTVQIDGVVFDLTANIRQKADGRYVYLIEMHENKEIEASSPEGSQESVLNGVPNTSTNSLQDDQDDVKPQFSISKTDSDDKSLSDGQRDFFQSSKARTPDGRLLVLYHQTEGNFTVFDPRRDGAGGRDNATPFGIFLKSSDRDIGLRGKKQMPLYANITNPLKARNREELVEKCRELSPEYAEIMDQLEWLNQDYSRRTEEAKRAIDAYIRQWREKNPDASRRALYGDEQYLELDEAEDSLIDEWSLKAEELDVRAKELITDTLKKAGYDGVFLAEDQGSFGRKTDAYIALSPNQVKNTDNLNPSQSDDIRFSISPPERQHAEQQTTEQAKGEDDPAEAPERKNLTAKARNYLQDQERKFLRDLGDKMYVPRIARRDWLKPIVQRISNAYLRDGQMDADTAEALFEEAYAKGIIVDAEFYHQYKPIRDHLRTTAVTLSKQDQADIADFADFKRRARYRLRIQEEGGRPVDVAYQELHGMAPELFPEKVTHPADQLQHMLDVATSIQISEKTISEYYGDSAREFREWAKGEFDTMIATMGRELQKVRRFADETSAKTVVPESPGTVEEVKEAYKVLKERRRELEKIQRKNLLTQSDEEQVGLLLKGKVQPEDLDPDKHNVEGILAVYEGKKGYEQQAKLIAQYRQHLRGKLRAQADTFLKTSMQWKDKATGLAYSRETMLRNLMDIIKDKDLAQEIYDTYFGTVHTSEAEANRFKTAMRDRIRALKLSTKVNKGDLVSESHAVQLYGEAMDNIAMIRASRGRMKFRDGMTEQQWQKVIQDMFDESPSLDRGKIERATEEFRKIYDELFERMNEVRIANGYEPINYRRGYFPHFQPGDEGGLLQQFGRSLGLDTQVSALPTTINGLTHTFRPGIQWFGNAQERLGFNTAYDALEGFDKYIEGAAGVIFHTENIQKLRALEAQIRYRTSPDGIRKQVDAVYADDRLTEEEKRMKVEDIYKNGQFTLSNFCNELTEYTNLLAGKKSRLDRTVESLMDRRIYTIMKNLESRVGANMVGGNLGSALTNFIPLTQAGAQMDRGMIVKGMWDTLRSYREDDGIIGASSFLTNRQGSDTLVKTWTQKASQVAGKPMEWIDGFVSGSIVRAAYQQNLKEGFSEAEAMYQADLFAAGVMGDRSRGAMPTLFESKNPVLKAFTQFQLEVNNQFSEVFKDLPRRYREKGAGVLAGVLLRYFLGAFLYNEVFEYLFGRRPAMDPIGILNDTAGDWLGYELPNLVEWGKNAVTGEETSMKTEAVGPWQAMANMGTEVVGQLPFSSGLALLGVETDGGRIPVSSAIPDFRAVWDAVSAKDWSGKKRWYEVQQELNKLAYLIPPFGGGQIAKSWKGIKAFLEGGSYSVNNAGEDILQYPVFREEDGITAFMQAALMGKSSLAEAQGWVESGFDSLSAKQTAVYQDLTGAGISEKDAFALIRELEGITKTESRSKAELQRERLLQADPEAAAIAYYGLLADDKTRELMDAMTDEGAEAGEVARALMSLQNAEGNAQKREVLLQAGLTDEEKHQLYREKISDDKEDEISQLRAAGLSFDDFLRIQNQYTQINDSTAKATEKARKFSHWVNTQKFTQRQKNAIKDSFTYYSMVPATAEKYDSLVAAGINEETAFNLVGKLDGLKPKAGKKTVDDLQKYRVVVDSGMPESRQMQALQTVIGEGLYERVSICQSNGVSPAQYLKFRELLPQYDANGSGTLSQKEVQAALDSMGSSGDSSPMMILLGQGKYGEGLTNAQKAVIWQSYNKTWKPNKNPYDKTVGQKVYALMNGEEADPAFSQSSGESAEELIRRLLEGMK